MKSLFIFSLLIFSVTLSVKAQQLDAIQIIPFDSEQYEKNLREKMQLDTLLLNRDTISIITNNPYTMRIIDVPQNEMAKMPNMPIRQDVHYQMQIKKYNNDYAPKSSERDYRILPDQKDKAQENPK
jgi:hypothetical protein